MLGLKTESSTKTRCPNG